MALYQQALAARQRQQQQQLQRGFDGPHQDVEIKPGAQGKRGSRRPAGGVGWTPIEVLRNFWS